MLFFMLVQRHYARQGSIGSNCCVCWEIRVCPSEIRVRGHHTSVLSTMLICLWRWPPLLWLLSCLVPWPFTWWIPGKQEALIQCCFNVGWMPRVCCQDHHNYRIFSRYPYLNNSPLLKVTMTLYVVKVKKIYVYFLILNMIKNIFLLYCMYMHIWKWYVCMVSLTRPAAFV